MYLVRDPSRRHVFREEASLREGHFLPKKMADIQILNLPRQVGEDQWRIPGARLCSGVGQP